MRPEATRSCRLKRGNVVQLKANGAARASVISIMPMMVPAPNSSR